MTSPGTTRRRPKRKAGRRLAEARASRERSDLIHRRELQRERMLSAAVSLVDEFGWEALKVNRILSLSRVPRKTFYEQFESRKDCLRAAIEDFVARAEEHAARASRTETDWTSRVRAGLLSLLELFDEESQPARVTIAYGDACDTETARYRIAVLQRLADAIEAGADGARSAPPRTTAEAIVAGTLGVIHARLVSHDSPQLTELLNPMMSFIVLPYRGAAAARRELGRPLPRSSPKRPPSKGRGADAWLELGVRTSYRTVRVIDAIAARPGVSNVQVAQSADILDAGQTSKLLSRLECLGIVENRGGADAGSKKAWHLTPLGRRLERESAGEFLGTRR